jgi:hypothetical protein
MKEVIYDFESGTEHGNPGNIQVSDHQIFNNVLSQNHGASAPEGPLVQESAID